MQNLENKLKPAAFNLRWEPENKLEKAVHNLTWEPENKL